jgi:TRAP-type mannitol/chloroaromatic compound transport system permease small subunit
MNDEQADPSAEHRHRVPVWALIVLGSVLLVFAIVANWVQREALNTDQVKSTTGEILEDKDIQKALGTYAVDQLYANVDVAAEIEKQLPHDTKPLAFPVAAAARQLATSEAQKALASPQVQGLVSNLVAKAQQRFVSLIENKDEFVSTADGNVTLDYGSVIADLATRIGIDPATISKLQDLVQSFSQGLSERLTAAEAQITTIRGTLAQAQGGRLTPTLKQNLRGLRKTAAELQGRIASLEAAIKGVQDKVPSQLKDRLSQLRALLSNSDRRLTELQRRTTAVLTDPSQANIRTLDPFLASLQLRINGLLDSQVVQTPGQLVLLKSSQLEGLQKLVSLLRNLGFVLPVLALLLYLGAIYLAKGWRRETLIAAGGGIIVATLFVLVARRLLGNGVDSLASSETVKPAVASVWDIISEGLRERALIALAVGFAFIGGGAIVGPTRREVAVRRFLAPYLRDHPVAVYLVVAALFLLWLSYFPGINNLGEVLVILMLAALAVVGIEILRRQTAREFPRSPNGP